MTGKPMATDVLDKERQGWFQRLLVWREQHVSERTFVLFLAFIVGLFCAVAAFALHGIINQIGMLLTSSFN